MILTGNDGTAVVTFITVETCGAYVGRFLYTPIKYSPHQMGVTNRLQVDKTCPVGYILAHVLIQRSFKELNQLETSVMGVIDKRFEGVVPYHGGTQKLAIILSFLFYASIFEIEGHIKWRHPALGLMSRI